MTNDTSTLSGSLDEMKDQLISELANKGVTATFSSSTGLLGLIDKIGDITQADVSGAISTIVGHLTFLTTNQLITDLLLPTWSLYIKDINNTGLNSKTVKLYVDGTYKTSEISYSGGNVWFDLDMVGITEGTHTLKAVFEGDSTHLESELEVTATFTDPFGGLIE